MPSPNKAKSLMYCKKINPMNLVTEQKHLSKMKASYKMKRAMEMDGRDGSTPFKMYLIKTFPQTRFENKRGSLVKATKHLRKN